MATKYNIIWIDDQVDELTGDFITQGKLTKKCINIVGKCRNARSFQEIISKRIRPRIDAIVTDANFPDDVFNADKDKDISGLIRITQLIERKELYNVPIFLFSGRPELCEANALLVNDFKESNRYFIKNTDGIDPLIESIIEEVELRKTTEFIVDNNYSEALNFAKMLDSIIPSANAEKFIRTNLIRSFDNRWDFETERPQEMLNTARKIVEVIFSVGKEWDILPPIESLNQMSIFLQNNPNKLHPIFRQIDGMEIMPKPLSRALWYYLDITQDGSHLKGDLELGVDAYVTDVQNANILRSVLHIAIDIIIWFVKYVDDCNTDDGMKKLWYKLNKSE